MSIQYDPAHRCVVDDEDGWTLKHLRTTREALTQMRMEHLSGTIVTFWADSHDEAARLRLGADAGWTVFQIVYRRAGEVLKPATMFRLPSEKDVLSDVVRRIETYSIAYLRHRLRQPDANVEISIPLP